MATGVIMNVVSVILGGFIGAVFGNKIPQRLHVALPLTFGIAAMGMGITLITKIHLLPPVILSLLLGSIIGELIKLEAGIAWLASKVREPIERLIPSKNSIDQGKFLEQFVSVVVLFCASATGIFGALNEGMTGDASILLSKSFLDFFTAAIFAASLGYIVLLIAIPQFIILMALFLSAGIIFPLTTPEMIADFSATGGIVLLATGLRISGIKSFPVANMLPALIIAMPISHYWTLWM